MKDICVMHCKEDEAYANNLCTELSVLGVRIQNKIIFNYKNLNNDLNQNLLDSASILLLITPKLIKKFVDRNIQLNKLIPQLILITFNPKKEEEETIKTIFNGVVISRNRSIKKQAIDIIRELDTEKRLIELRKSDRFEDIWDSPITIYKKITGLGDESEIIIDVTWSAIPTRPQPAPALLDTLRDTISLINNGKPIKILDFGAGKLRHTVKLLEKDHTVTAVEYNSLFHNPTKQVEDFLKTARSYGKKFGKVTYPVDLIKLNKKHDLVLLVNIINIIPDPLERLFVLTQSNEKLSNNKYLLWFTQYGDLDQRNTASDYITDGGCAQSRSRSTFYTECNRETIDILMGLCGFSRIENSFNSGKNQAWLYKKNEPPLIDVQEITENNRASIGRKAYVGSGENAIIVGDVIQSKDYTSLGDVLQYQIKKIPLGKAKAYRYEDIIRYAIQYAFMKHIKPPEIVKQYPIQRGRQRIDIKADWRSNSTLKEIIGD